MPVVELTPAQINSGLRSGFRLSLAQFTFSIPTMQSFWETTTGNYTGANQQPFQNYSLLDAAQATAFRAAIAAWDRLIAPNFTEVADDATTHGEIRVAFTSNQMTAGTAAYAFQGSNQVPTSIVGDVWLNSNTVGQSFASGTDNYDTFLHELGHTLGLKHSFEGTAIPSPYEDQRYTIMSYNTAKPYFTRGFAPTQGGGLTTTTTRVIVTTPMVLDVAAVQGIYGADTTTAAGNDTYTFSQDSTAIQTIYDAGGLDTWDLSSSTRNNIVDLRPGAYSSIGYWTIAEQIAYWQAQYPGFASFIANNLNAGDTANGGPWYEWRDNVGIAFSTTIENVIGGSGNDSITGNDAANLINLRLGGNDNVAAGAGDDGVYFGATFTAADVVDGGAGTLDQVALQGNYAAAVTLSATSLVNVEQVVVLSGADTSFGDTAGNNYSYNLVLNDANVAAGQVLSFSANTLRAGENFTLNASAETNGQIVTYGGAGTDTITGGQQNDGFFFGNGLWGAFDRVDGQGGSFDQLAIQGNYTGANAITFQGFQLTSIENLVLLSASDLRFGNGGTAYSYSLTMSDANVAAGASFAISANTLTSAEILTLNAQAEANAAYTVFSGAGNDTIRTGGGADRIYGGGGRDQLTGGAGNDIFAYTKVSDSTVSQNDLILDFTTGDRIDLSLVDADSTQAGVQHFVYIGSASPTAAGQLQVINGGGGLYFVQGRTGSAGIDFLIQVTTDHALTPADFTGLNGQAFVAPPGVDLDETAPEVAQVIDSHIMAPTMPADLVFTPDRVPGEPLTADLFINNGIAPLGEVSAFAPDQAALDAFGHTEWARFVMEPPIQVV